MTSTQPETPPPTAAAISVVAGAYRQRDGLAMVAQAAALEHSCQHSAVCAGAQRLAKLHFPISFLYKNMALALIK
jgi:hypothetical protein